MKRIAILLMGAFAATSAISPIDASARGVIGVSVGFAPPPPRVERVVVARPGRVRVPGAWHWNGRRYVWVAGTWIAARPGYRYVPARWIHRGPRWVFHAGYWVR